MRFFVSGLGFSDALLFSYLILASVFLILDFRTIPKDTKDNRHSGHVNVQNKRNNQNLFVKSTPTLPL